MAKIIRLRLYRVQDYDLYALYYDKKNYHLSKMCLAAVSAFANGRPLPSFSMKDVQTLPKPLRADNGEIIRESGVKFTLIMSFSIPDYDTKAIALMEYPTKENTANSFVKTLVRRCFVDMEYMYLDKEHQALFPDPGAVKELVPVYPQKEKKKKAYAAKKKKPAASVADAPTDRNTPEKRPVRQEESPESAVFTKNSQEDAKERPAAPVPSNDPAPAAAPASDAPKSSGGLFDMIHEFEM